ncbi:MAG: aminoglycoside phosphotransferase family protein [Bacteroidetes bacterium]|nr:aminoglycoside phosphotransferase family protein [Bacteroidota bacterium]
MKEILAAFSLDENKYRIDRIGTGHIHETFRVLGPDSWILQRVNKNVFLRPEVIARNWRLAADYLLDTEPNYVFLRPALTVDGKEMVVDGEGWPWRMFPYLSGTVTIDCVSTEKEAYAAAAAFGGLTRRLNNIPLTDFQETIPHFHDLALRFDQFGEALAGATPERIDKAASCIESVKQFGYLVSQYQELVDSGELRRRITHNDTKINNVLLDEKTREARCVIDLDTLMPGYFIYDFGDMVRTFVSPVDENEKDINRISFRENIYRALHEGYLDQMGMVMSAAELKAIPFAGKMMTYIMSLRFLADFLNGDVYYHTAYIGHNLVRARNQLRYLEILSARFS